MLQIENCVELFLVNFLNFKFLVKFVKFTIHDFEQWLKERGYDERMGKENFKLFLELGFASLLFYNSSLLFSFIFNKVFNLGESERIDSRIRFEIAKRIKKIYATKYEIIIEI